MDNKKKVFWYCEKWQVGGIQTVQMHLLDNFDSDRLSFDIVVSEDNTDIYDEDIINAGARKIVTLDRRYKSPARRVLANIFAVRKILKNDDYDVAHFNVCHGVELIYVYWAKRFGIKKRIVHCRNNDIGAGGKSRRIKLLAHKICKRLFRNAPNVRLANSDLAAKWLFTENDIADGKVRILNNGIETARYLFDAEKRRDVRAELSVENNTVIGHVGHFSYQKNHEFLLNVFAELLKNVPDSVLMLIGSGDVEEKIRSLAEELGISKSVLFCGLTKDVPAYMFSMDAFVLPSRFEGFGNVLVEAQAAGLKCFASKGVIPEAVRLTDKLTWIELKDGAKEWARIIAETDFDYPRDDEYEKVLHSGYDIADMAKNLQDIYCS